MVESNTNHWLPVGDAFLLGQMVAKETAMSEVVIVFLAWVGGAIFGFWIGLAQEGDSNE